MVTKSPGETQQEMQDQLAQLEDNKVFKEVQTQLTQLLKTKRKAQRSALQSLDSMGVFGLEAQISGIEEFFKVYEGQIAKLDKLNQDSPTVLRY